MTPAGGGCRFLAAGNPRPVLEAVLGAAGRADAALALVLETDGSTYSRAGAMALFAGQAQAGWLSGGCLEPELARRAAQAALDGRADWIEIDTRDDEDLFSGSAVGCRGRLRIALLPLAAMAGVADVLQAWLQGGVVLERTVDATGDVILRTGERDARWQLPAAPPEWSGDASRWSLSLAPLPEVLLLGAGPESPALLRLLRELGWRTTLVEPRERWRDAGTLADAHHEAMDAALRDPRRYAAALVMHHGFERDRDALERLSATPVAFVGLLGPPRRRDDLLGLLSPLQREALTGRLHAPVGLDLGGQGPEAIALSIAAQLQQWRARAGEA
jgi:xanthine dehydrogenase accessory factor